jgi:hypothetical protein
MNSIFNDVEIMKKSGFTGFLTIGKLMDSRKTIDKTKGVYFVLYLYKSPPTFVEKGTGGYFKGKDPNVSIDVLKENWVDNTKVVYIGRGGQKGKKSTLRKRLSQYLRFGQGKNVGHSGGRYIYQIVDSKQLVICWKTVGDPEKVESELIDDFILIYEKLPFGNLRR